MPSVDKIKSSKKFVKKEYRPWNIDGDDDISSIVQANTDQEIPTVQLPSSDDFAEIDTNLIIRWKYKDRPSNEYGDIESLAKTIKEIGQQVPCIVRRLKDKDGYYELIAGERRWKATEILGIKLKCVVKNIDDHTAALIQAVENEKREGLSDYAKGMSYSEKISNGILSQTDLTGILGISKQQVSRLLSFSKIPKLVLDAISDMSKVSARTAEEIKRLANKGENYISIILQTSDKLKTGSMGAASLCNYVEKNISGGDKLSSKQIKSPDGRHIFTWRIDNNSSPSIHFPKDIANLISNEKINKEIITNEIMELIILKLKGIQ